MPTLHLSQRSGTDGQHCVEVRLSGVPNLADMTAVSAFPFSLTDGDRRDLRWYLEDFLQYPHEPAPAIARRVEGRIATLGTELFNAVFQSSPRTTRLWARLEPQLNDTRVEIASSVGGATAIPWELLRDPMTDSVLALHAPVFTRVQQATARPAFVPAPVAEGEPIRIVLAICRPGGRGDVPFRSVATRLIKGLTEQTHQRYQLDVLRPPTFARLGEVLRKGREEGRPYHIVHFDGHGAYLDTPNPDRVAEWLRGLGAIMLGAPRAGPHGYLCFENAHADGSVELVDGTTLGDLLYETQTPALVLNACRSAHAAPLAAPETATADDAHEQVRAFGSLAQEVIDQGVAGVVAMRYNVYVVTAAQFVADLYSALARGRSLGEAVTHGRKQLHARPERAIAYDPVSLQDWPVPVVFEAAPIQLFPRIDRDDGTLRISISAGSTEAAKTSDIDHNLPSAPDAGFFGRDETLLALDRAFDNDGIVLLHAFAGSGKTATAAEFARWCHQTGGLSGGPVLFTSFEHYTPLRSALSHFGQVFAPLLKANGVNWPALTQTEQMRDVALQVMRQVPVLWVWDNVEPVHGFPAGSESHWPGAEQDQLRDFLRAVRDTKGRILLTSRRDESDWLGELPHRVVVPPMPVTECAQLARALVERRGYRFTAVADWRPLLEFTQGNPLTLTVLVGQALRQGLTSKEQVDDFVEKLKAGETTFVDAQTGCRATSLGAALSYGFDAAFSDIERQRLALLHLFQGFVDVDVLCMMGMREADWRLPGIEGLSREEWIGLLDRAADIGLLTAHGEGYYSIHPALPWFLKSLEDRYYPGCDAGVLGTCALPDAQGAEPGTASSPLHSFVEAVGLRANRYCDQYVAGNRDIIAALAEEEANLLTTRRVARANAWHRASIGALQGLYALYDHTSRRVEWMSLVEEAICEFVDPTTDGPLPGCEEQWGIVTLYRVWLARETRNWAEAEGLQNALMAWARERAKPFLGQPSGALNDASRHILRTFRVSLHELAQIQRERGRAACATHYQESLRIAELTGDRAGAAVVTFNLGTAYKDIPALRNLDEAQVWYRRSLDLTDESDRVGRAKCLTMLGNVALARVLGSQTADASPDRNVSLVEEAMHLYHQSLAILPEDEITDRAIAHNQLGCAYAACEDIDRALVHYRDCIQLMEAADNVFGAAQTRSNVASTLAGAGRLTDAREYARAALRNFEAFGPRATAEAENARRLLAQIERDLGTT